MNQKSPSLREIYQFIQKYHEFDDGKKEILNKYDLSVIFEYCYNDISILECQELINQIKRENKYENDKPMSKSFYLGGFIKISLDDHITQNLIENVEKKIQNIDFTACWGEEIYRVREHLGRFENFKKIYKFYLDSQIK